MKGKIMIKIKPLKAALSDAVRAKDNANYKHTDAASALSEARSKLNATLTEDQKVLLEDLQQAEADSLGAWKYLVYTVGYVDRAERDLKNALKLPLWKRILKK